MADPQYLREQAAAARRTADACDPVEAEDLLNLALIYEQVADRCERHMANERRRPKAPERRRAQA